MRALCWGCTHPMTLKDSAGASVPATARGRSRYDWMEREVAVSLSQGPLGGSTSVARLASWGEKAQRMNCQ